MAKKIIFTIIALIVFILLLIGAYLLTPIKTKHNLKIPSSSSSEVIKYLNSKNYSTNFIDRVFLNIFPAHKGWVYINKKELPRYKFLLALNKKGNYYTPLTIIPGETSYFILRELASKFNYNLPTLETYYKKMQVFKEGNFIANTYNIPRYFNEKKTLEFLLNHSFKIHQKIAKKYNLDYKTSDYKRFLTIASIIQKEAANKKEMPLIASVIYNRLKKNMRLQMDGSLNYGKYSHSKVTPKRIKEDKSYYNTYKHKGLPKEPICNVSTNALEAAFNPASTNYLYFMKQDDKTHSFSSTFKEHRKNIKKRKQKLQQ